MGKFKNFSKVMSATKPLRMWIDGKCFELKKYGKLKKVNSLKDILANEGKGDYEMEFDFESEENGHFSTAFQVPSIYYIRLGQIQNFDIKLLEEETNTKIIVPKNGNEGKIKISSENAESVAVARHYLHSLLGEIRDKTTAAQFVSIPTKSEEIAQNFEKFKNEIINGDPIEGIHESIFQETKKLHLTVVVFALMDEKEKSEAIKALHDYKTEVFSRLIEEHGTLKIRVAGIECMNDNPEKANVIYANAQIVNEDDKKNLQSIVNGISDHFYERGLVRQYQDEVKLHVTLMNSKYRKASSNPSSPAKRNKWFYKRQTFNAKPILEKYKDYHFGECDFDSIHLSYISSKADDGFYKPLAVITV